jgi:hypothetical protein
MKLKTPMKHWHNWKGITYVIDMEGRRYQMKGYQPKAGKTKPPKEAKPPVEGSGVQ